MIYYVSIVKNESFQYNQQQFPVTWFSAFAVHAFLAFYIVVCIDICGMSQNSHEVSRLRFVETLQSLVQKSLRLEAKVL